jgi:hypothetical protein
MPEKTYNEHDLPLDNEQAGDNINKEDENDNTNLGSIEGTRSGGQSPSGGIRSEIISRRTLGGSGSLRGNSRSLIPHRPLAALESIDIRGEDARSPLEKNSAKYQDAIINNSTHLPDYKLWESVDALTAPVRILVNTASLESGRLTTCFAGGQTWRRLI